MSYIALYRKYRPDSFAKIIEQKHIVDTIKNQIEHKRISHAYLFTGTRGTGKTSLAKIFAKAINCLEPIDGDACNKCEICIRINEDSVMDIIEIDAASNNGVENIRDIKEEIRYLPSECKYKVYIIDEVHMLSISAFNALLKTLEEPPAHIVFILATTDVQKIPATILSRCQRFDFKRLSVKAIKESLKAYMENENVIVDDDALEYVALRSDGAMRDALSIMDQVISFNQDEKIDLERILDLLAEVDSKVLFDLADGIVQKNSFKIIETIDYLLKEGKDIKQFLDNFIVHLRNLLISKQIDDLKGLINLSDENIEKIKKQAKDFSVDELLYIIKILSESDYQIKYASNPRVIFELNLFKIMTSYQDGSVDALKSRMSELERMLLGKVFVENKKNDKNVKEDTKEEKPVKEKNKPVIKASKKIEDILKDWDSFINKFDDPFRALLREYTRLEASTKDSLQMLVKTEFASIDVLNNRLDEIKEKMIKAYGDDFMLKIVFENQIKLSEKTESSLSVSNKYDKIKTSIKGIEIDDF